MQRRIAGKLFRKLSLTELKSLIYKLEAIGSKSKETKSEIKGKRGEAEVTVVHRLNKITS